MTHMFVIRWIRPDFENLAIQITFESDATSLLKSYDYWVRTQQVLRDQFVEYLTSQVGMDVAAHVKDELSITCADSNVWHEFWLWFTMNYGGDEIIF